MATESANEHPDQTPVADDTADHPYVALHSPGYLALLLLAGLIGVPISLVAFGFLAAVHKLEHLVWHDLPDDLGFDGAPFWWPVVVLTLAGLIVGLTVTHVPGGGGHIPVTGLHAGTTPPNHIPGILLTAAASLVLGAVIGPEAPLIAIGSGLAVLAAGRTKAAGNVRATTVIGASGSAAAISAIFGNPLVAAVIFLEVVGLARRQAMLVILPCLVSSGVGALIFTGLGNWSGLGIGSLAIPDLEPAKLAPGNLLWALPLAAVVAVVTRVIFGVGRRTAKLAVSRTVEVTVAAALLAGCSAGVYTLLTDHPPDEVALSGQATLGVLAGHPEAWSTGALILLLLCKGLAFALCIAVFRGGTVFPALFLGAVLGVLASIVLPGVDTVSGLAIGMAAGAAVMGLPIASVVLVVLLMGADAADLIPVIILGAVTALVIAELLQTWPPSRATTTEAESAGT